MQYLRYLYAWYKNHGLSLRYPIRIFNEEGKLVAGTSDKILSPFTWYKIEQERLVWINAAKALKALPKRHDGGVSVTSPEYQDFSHKYGNRLIYYEAVHDRYARTYAYVTPQNTRKGST